MSLRVRLFLTILLIGLAMLGAVLTASYIVHADWEATTELHYGSRLRDILGPLGRESFGPRGATAVDSAAARVRAMLDPDRRARLANAFGDVVVVDHRASDGDRDRDRPDDTVLPSYIDLNPLGAAHRDPRTFPQVEIRNGIGMAIRNRTLVAAGGGLCVPIVSAEGAVLGGAWLQPLLPPPPQLPLAAVAVPILCGTVLFGIVIYLTLGRSVARPLERIAAAAGAIGHGHYDVRLEGGKGPREFGVVIDAFNRMTEKVAGHHAELRSEVARATAEGQRKERALVRSGRLASMGTMAAGIAHEINNPIGGMINAIRRIARNESLSERDREYVELIEDGLGRVSRIARRMLDFSPREREARPYRVEEAIEATRAMVEHRLRAQGVELVVRASTGLPDLVGDPHELQQVLLNLLINSLDVLEGRPDPRIEVATDSAGERVVITVRDNGPGTTAEDLERVMDPFFTAKNKAGASGLGMFISHSIVTNQGGSMTLDSAPGEGFLVRIELPAG